MSEQRDFVDGILEQWKKERPDLDTGPMAVLARVARLESCLDRLISEELSRYDLGRGEFDILATLRRNGMPFRLNPKTLSSRLMLSSGAMTSRLDRLESRALIRRVPDQSDRRSMLIELTAAGLETIDRIVTEHVVAQSTLLAPLNKAERKELAGLLRKMLLSVE